MAELRLLALKPSRRVVAVKGLQTRVDRELRDFAGDFIRTMATYPAAMPWKGRTPKSGPRRGGRRTGTYGKGWRLGVVMPGSIEAVNRVEYAVHVGGPKTGAKGKRQAEVMAARHWPNLTEVSDRLWAQHKPAIQRAISVTP